MRFPPHLFNPDKPLAGIGRRWKSQTRPRTGVVLCRSGDPAARNAGAGFEKERDELNLAHPETDACKAAITRYNDVVKEYDLQVAASLKASSDIPAELADKARSFPNRISMCLQEIATKLGAAAKN